MKRNKSGQFIISRKSYWKGKHLPEKVKKQISQTNKRKGIVPPSRKGIKMSEIEKKKRSKIAKEKGMGRWMKGRPNKRKGEKSNWWKGGITPLREQIRHHFKYRQWISDIFTRDDFTCQKCGQKRGRLSAHHIKSFSKIIEENQIKTLEEALNCEELWNINNGITFCFKCHKLTDNYGGTSDRILS